MILEKKVKEIVKPVFKVSSAFADDRSEKIENQNTEEKFERNRQEILAEVAKCKEERDFTVNHILEINEFIRETEVEIDANKRKMQDIEEFLVKGRNSRMKGKMDSDKSFNEERQIKAQYAEIAEEIKYLESKKSKKKLERRELKLLLEKVDAHMERARSRLTKVNNLLNEHYHNILSKGVDTRAEGIVWVMKAIFRIGKTVILSFLPTFLDEKAIEYLFEVFL